MPQKPRETAPLSSRLCQWRSVNQFSDLHAVTLIRRRWLDITVLRLLDLEAGAEPTVDELQILDGLLPRSSAGQPAA